MPKHELATLTLAVLGALLAAACGDGPTTPEAQNLQVMLTDDHTQQVAEVNIFFESLTVKRSGAPTEHDVPIVLQDNPQDLLVLTDDVVALAVATLEPGSFEFIRIEIDEEQSGVVEIDGTRKPLRIPSTEVKVQGPFEIPESGLSEIVLDFDAEASLVRLGNGDWLLTPVVVVDDADVSG